MSEGIYESSAKTYLRGGWWPIPVSGKAYPEPGTTGKDGTVDRAKVKALVKSRPRQNVALRHDGTIALDVDDYGAKEGAATLEAKAAKWGDLPPTWSSTSRGEGDPSRQYFYRVPEGITFVGAIVPDVEVIHHDYRYSVVWPSKHPKTGMVYKWYTPDGLESDRPPRVDELTELPAKWVKKLTLKPHVEAEHLERFDLSTLSSEEHDRLGRWVMSAVDGVAADLRALADAATEKADDYKGPPWNTTVFAKATRLAELANAPWSNLTLAHAKAVLWEHAPRDKGFDDKTLELIWQSATKTASGHDLALPVVPNSEVFTIPLTKREKRQSRTDPAVYFDKSKGLRAEKLADTLSADLAVGPDGRVWVYEGGVWVPRDEEIERRVIRALGDEFRPAHAATIRAIVTKGHDIPRLDGAPDTERINLRSGMLNWRTGTLEAHNPEHLSTVQLPLEYVEGATCPAFDRWLAEVVPAEVVPMVWEVIGYMLMSGNPFHQAVLLHGDGGNGKSTFLRVLLAMLGKHNTSAVTLRSMTEGKFEVAGLFGKIANVAGDIDARYLKDSSQFKAITGQDVVEAQHKYGHPFDFTPWAVPIFSANELWRSSDTTEGYFRRWLTIPFPNKVIGKRRLDERELYAEAPGILNHALESLRVLMARGGFELAGAAADLKHEFEEESDMVRVWLREDERIVAHEAGNTALRTRRPDLHRRYADWSRDTGHLALASTSFYRRLARLGYGSATVRGERLILGIKLDIANPIVSWQNVAGVWSDDTEEAS